MALRINEPCYTLPNPSLEGLGLPEPESCYWPSTTEVSSPHPSSSITTSLPTSVPVPSFDVGSWKAQSTGHSQGSITGPHNQTTSAHNPSVTHAASSLLPCKHHIFIGYHDTHECLSSSITEQHIPDCPWITGQYFRISNTEQQTLSIPKAPYAACHCGGHSGRRVLLYLSSGFLSIPPTAARRKEETQRPACRKCGRARHSRALWCRCYLIMHQLQ